MGAIHPDSQTIASSSNVAGDIRHKKPGILEKYLCQELMAYEMKMLGPPALHGHFTVETCSWPLKSRRRFVPDWGQQRRLGESAKCK
jgi:hypothetical protein